jgi:riboflavin biosynthesis pyrimidine reductase
MGRPGGGALLRSLGARGGEGVDAAELVAALGLRDRPERTPRVVAAMIASADGRVAVQGRSVGLGHPADRALLRSLRAGADAVLVGAATVRAERYANLLDADQAAAREAAGLSARPVVAVLSRSGDVPWEVGLFAEPDSAVAVYTGTGIEAPELAARVEVHEIAGLREVLAHLGEHHGARVVLCEGGPRLLHALVSEGLLDELLLTVAPLLAAGAAPAPLEGAALDPPGRLALIGVWRADDHAFLHYRALR